MSLSTVLVSAIAALPLAHGIAFGGAPPTGVATNADRAGNGWTPKPTKAPILPALRRQVNIFSQTCGWVDGVESSAITCATGRTCIIYTASDIAMAGCCDGDDTQNCGWAKSCVNYDAYTKSSCGPECMSDTFIRKCTRRASPYCVTWTYPSDNIADYGCASYNTGVETVYQTAKDVSRSSTYTTSKSLPTITGLAVTGWDGEESSPTSRRVPTTRFTIGPTPTPRPTPKKKSNTAAIAGGVVGGLAALAIAGALIFFFFIRKKKAKQLAANQQTIAAVQANQQYGQGPPPPQPQMQQQYGPPMGVASPPMGVQSPPPQHHSFFMPAHDHKIKHQSQVPDYGVQSPISQPSSPAPAYVQPHYSTSNTPPVSTQSPAPYVGREPTPGTHEVDAITAPQPLPGQANLYEMGSGR